MPAPAKTDRDTILAAALLRLRREGIEAVSMRALAADVGIAANALYHYFPSRSDLENALSDRAAQRMRQAIERDMTRAQTARVQTARRGRAEKLDSEARIRTLAAAYLRFAQREPHLYDAMIQGPCAENEPREGHTALWNLVYEAAAALHGEAEASDAAVSLWALLHGTVSLLKSGALKMKPKESIRFGLNAWLRSS